MVDPRIYRALLAFVLLAVIVFGFSLTTAAGHDNAQPSPEQFFMDSYGEMNSLAARFPDRNPGSAPDDRLAGYLDRRLSSIKNGSTAAFAVRKTEMPVSTASGTREIENVVASEPGLDAGTIVVISHRDATGPNAVADMSGSAVLIGLANALAGATLDRGVELISTSAQVGAAGATAIAKQFKGQSVDAVIVLGNLAGAQADNPIVVPWSGNDTLAPSVLRSTVAHFVTAETGLKVNAPGLGAQLVRLSFPFALTEQAPFNTAGIPSVLLSLSGDQVTPAKTTLAPATSGRIAQMGTAVLESVDALDAAATVAAPSSYLVISGKQVPMWAVKLLVLVLILPVAATAVDALARARRRGHSLLRWVGWVLSGIIPFAAGLIALYVAHASGALSAAPPGAVAAHAVPVTGADVAVVLATIAVIVLACVFLRPLCLKLASRVADVSNRPQTPAADAAAVALSLVMCVLALVVWLVNPYTALLFTPALHLWLWLAQPGLRSRRVAVMLVVLAALLPAVPILIFYFGAYGLGPWTMLWSVVLMIAGGAMPPLVAVYGAFTLGCFGCAMVIALRAARASASGADGGVTVRGPSTYAGPGSLGGTQSALRR